jgi:hypothetical protein
LIQIVLEGFSGDSTGHMPDCHGAKSKETFRIPFGWQGGFIVTQGRIQSNFGIRGPGKRGKEEFPKFRSTEFFSSWIGIEPAFPIRFD